MERSFFCATEKQTGALGELLGKFLQAGDLLCLNGDLGAGKTTFTKAVAKALGFSPAEITSPTFTILNIYQNESITLQHFDLYRLQEERELEEIGFAQQLSLPAVTVIEWSELFPSYLPEEYLEVKINLAQAGRKITFFPVGKRYEELTEEVWHAYPRN